MKIDIFYITYTIEMNHFNKPILMSEETIPVYNLHGKLLLSIPKSKFDNIMPPKQNNQTMFKPVPINPNPILINNLNSFRPIPINNLNSLSPFPIFPNANVEKKIQESKPKKNDVEFEGKFKDIKIRNIIIKEFEGKIKK